MPVLRADSGGMFKKLALAFSVANLCFFKTWRNVLSPEAAAYLYLWKQYPGFIALVALLINVLLLTGVFFFGFTLAWRYRNPFWRNCVRLAFLVIFLRSLNGVRVQFESLGTAHLRLMFGRIGFLVIGMSLLALLIFLIARYSLMKVTRVAAAVALVLSPFGFLALSQGVYLLIKYEALVAQERPSIPLLSAAQIATAGALGDIRRDECRGGVRAPSGRVAAAGIRSPAGCRSGRYECVSAGR